MNTVCNDPCQALKQRNQWINYRLEPLPGGKTNKIPSSPVNDSSAWTSYDKAFATGEPVGFVFTREDPFFFVDIDDCIDPGWQYSQLATDILMWLPGCAVEVSQSGNGLHCFGTVPVEVRHACKNTNLHIELYTESRFVAFTGNFLQNTGAADYRPDPETWQAFVETYFPPSSIPVATVVESGPCPEWSGPADDNELIQKAIESQSARSLIGAEASFRDLWEGNLPADCDKSSMDMKLCNMLAFWTGRDRQRVERLWAMSALGRRDKFKNRPDYVSRTVADACSFTSAVYNDGGGGGGGVKPQALNGPDFLDPGAQKELFKDYVYVQNLEKIFTPKNQWWTPSKFKNAFTDHKFFPDFENGKPTTDAWKAYLYTRPPAHTKVDDVCFRPDLPPREIITGTFGLTRLNTYVPVNNPVIQGDPGPFLDLIARMLPDSNDQTILLSYMAAVVQYPGVKFRWAPVLQGAEGNGKSILSQFVAHCVGKEYATNVTTDSLKSQFNSWVSDKIFVYGDEMNKEVGVDIVNRLKALITDTDVIVEAKGQDRKMIESVANFFFCMNSKDTMQKHRNDRRLCIFYTAQQNPGDIERSGMGGVYFTNLVNWRDHHNGNGIVNWYLRQYQIPEELNPAGTCCRAPITSSTTQAIIEARSTAATYLAEAVDMLLPGFRGGWVSSRMFNDLMVKETGRRLGPNKLPHVMMELGYTRICVASRLIPQEGGCQPVLYVQDDVRQTINIDQDATGMYCLAQGYPDLI